MTDGPLPDGSDLDSVIERRYSDWISRNASDLAAYLRSHARSLWRAWRSGRWRFEQRLRELWREAFDAYETFERTAFQIGSQFNVEHSVQARTAGDIKTIMLIELHARCCRIAGEVRALLAAGSPAGALSRARTMHEIAVTATFISQHGTDVAQRYVDHDDVERWRAAHEYENTIVQSHGASHGYDALDHELVDELDRRYEELKGKYGNAFVQNQQFGWATDALNNDRAGIWDLRAAVGMKHLSPYYRLASHDVHPGPRGNQLNYVDDATRGPIVLAGPTNGGLTDAAMIALISLHQTTAALVMPWIHDQTRGGLLRGSEPDDSLGGLEERTQMLVYVFALDKMLPWIEDAFTRVQRQIDECEPEFTW